MKRFITISLMLFLAFPLVAQNKAIEYYNKSKEARQKNDLKGFVDYTLKALEYLPGNSTLRYQLALGYALTGKSGEALKQLSGLIDMGLFLDAGEEKDFKPLHSIKGWKQLLEKIKIKKRPVVHTELAFVILQRDLIPEGITYDPVEKAFYLGSLGHCKIIKVDTNGKITDFTTDRQDGLLSVVGMTVDVKRRWLWACHGHGYPNAMLPKESWGSTGIYKYHLKTGKLIKKYMLPKEQKRFLNDVTLAPDGTAYISDSFVSAVFKIDPEKDELEKLADLPEVIFPNGIAYSSKTRKVFVSGASRIAAIDVNTGQVKYLGHGPSLYIPGHDGMYYYKGSLIGLQNMLKPNRVVRMTLDHKEENVTGLQLLDSYNPDVEQSTTGVIAGDYFYFMANIDLDAFDKEGKLPPPDKLEPVRVLRFKLQ